MNWEDESSLLSHEDTGFTSEQYLDADYLNRKVQEVIETMPEKCGIIFSLSRYNDMNYADIAGELNISVKTAAACPAPSPRRRIPDPADTSR